MGADRCAPIGHTCARGLAVRRRHPVVSVCVGGVRVLRAVGFRFSLFISSYVGRQVLHIRLVGIPSVLGWGQVEIPKLSLLFSKEARSFLD